MIKGFILSRTSYDQSGRAVIVLWIKSEQGAIKVIVDNQQAIFFLLRSTLPLSKKLLKQHNIQFVSQLLSLKTFQHEAIAGLYFDSISEFYQAKKILTSNQITLYESSFRMEDRFLMERFIHAGVTLDGFFQKKSQHTELTQVKLKSCDYKPELEVLSIDIECSDKNELFSIGFYQKRKRLQDFDVFQLVLMIGKPLPENKENSFIEWCDDEKDLLTKFIATINQCDPDIIIGWNVINFDFKIIIERAELFNIRLNIGRDGSAVRWRSSNQEANIGFVSIAGRVVVDGIFALKAEAYNFPSFSLEAMAQHFLNKGKDIDSVDNRLQQILYDFKHNKIKLAKYNLQDCVLVWDIFEKAQLMDFLIFRSQLTGLELDRAGGSVAAFTHLYLPKLHREGYISPNLPGDGGLASPGGYVMDSFPGLYKNVLLLDFKSLYPSIIRTFKIDPLGLIEGLKNKKDAIEGFRGACFSRKKHLLPHIITRLWQQRENAKTNQDQARSQAIKILMNSFYGVLGSGGCPFYDTRLASSITLRGHWIMQKTAAWIEKTGWKVIYGDTDSTFVLLGDDVDDYACQKIGQQLVEMVNQQWDRYLQRDFQLESFLEMEFETHFSRFLMPTIRGSEKGSKKRYAGIVKQHQKLPSKTVNKKGDLKKIKLVFKGLENVRTDWTLLAKNFQEELYLIIFSDRDPSTFIQKTVQTTLAGERDKELVYRKRLRRKLTSYVKNIPPHVRAAKRADSINQIKNKPLKYQYKGWISYLITHEGPQAVEHQSSPIDYQHYIDKQIQPIADAILPFIGLSFERIIDNQLGLFD